jgi:hypothetical protein
MIIYYIIIYIYIHTYIISIIAVDVILQRRRIVLEEWYDWSGGA